MVAGGRAPTVFGRLMQRARRWWLPLVLLDAGAAYLFATHIALRESALDLLGDLAKVDPRSPQSLLIEHSAQELVTKSLLALGLALLGAILSISVLLGIAWSVRCLRKSRRFAVLLEALPSEGEAVRIVDISSNGCRLELPREVRADALARLTAEGVELPPARVVWTGGHSAGLEFVRPLDANVLERLRSRAA